MGFNPPSRRRVRIIGRIRGFTEQESRSLDRDSKPWISVCKTQEEGASAENGVTLSFSDQSTGRKDALYKLDYCYEQDEDNGTIFSREIQPLILNVVNGGNASIIAYGAKGSGKTYTIQGFEDKPGLAVLSMTELLSKAEEAGKLVSVSILEVHHEHAYDLLDPKHSEIQVLEDGRGKINLKGLTQVPVKSVSEFQNIYLQKLNISNSAQKIPLELPKRSHKCLLMHVLGVDDNANTKIVGKMNFVDLAGYEDTRRSSNDGIALLKNTRTIRSLSAVMNVIYALNANEIHVPYRESKLTRIFQDSLCSTNHVVMLTCLNPHFCQDTLHTLSLASRSCQTSSIVLANPTKGDKSLARKCLSSHNKMKPPITPSTLKSKAGSTTKANCASKGRKLFEEMKEFNSNQASHDDQTISGHDLTMASKESGCEGNSTSESFLESESIENDMPIGGFPTNLEQKENDSPAVNQKNKLEIIPEIICKKSSSLENADRIEMEGGSPPLSTRLRELSNNLKLFSSTLCVNFDTQLGDQTSNVTSTVEPKTPILDHGTRVAENSEMAKYISPWKRLNNCSSGMKDSLVQEYLKFLNTADKEELKRLRGIGEKRASYILELREESPEPFKSLDDLGDIGLSAKQVKGMVRRMSTDLFS